MSLKHIDAKKRKSIIDALNGILADTFVLYYKTHADHWNVEGPHFPSLHQMFMEQYTDMWNALDELAERLRALEAYAPISLKALAAHAELKESGQLRDANQMVKDLAEDHEDLCNKMSKVIALADSAEDQVTADLLTVRLGIHEKTAWMLRSFLK